MQLGLILLLIEVALIVHAAKTGRFWPWGFIILFIPGFGALAYVLIELLPEWFGSTQGQQARRRVVSTLDPGRRYRELADQLQVADTIANRAALAEECLALGKFEEALGHYEHILALPMGDDAIYALGKARAQFGFGNPQQAVATLDDLRERWPDYQSAEGHLLYARALEESGRTEDALSEYQAVANYYPGPRRVCATACCLPRPAATPRRRRSLPRSWPNSSGRPNMSGARRRSGSRLPKARCAIRYGPEQRN